VQTQFASPAAIVHCQNPLQQINKMGNTICLRGKRMCKNATPTECKASEDATLEELVGTLGTLLPSSTAIVVSTVAALLDSDDLVASRERFVFMLAPKILYAPPPSTHPPLPRFGVRRGRDHKACGEGLPVRPSRLPAQDPLSATAHSCLVSCRSQRASLMRLWNAFHC
jgi:hypothetical protein